MSLEIGKQRTTGSAESQFQNSLVNRVKRGDVSMQQLVMDRSAFSPLKRNSKLLTDYVIQRIDEFIGLLISTDDLNVRSSAIKILCCGNKRIVQAVAVSPKILEYGENLTESSDLERFSIIVETCLSEFPETISDTFSFLPSLCKYAKRSSVYYMFHKLLQPNDFLNPIHYYLKMLGFPNLVALEAMKADDDKDMQYALLQILIFCLKCPILESCSLGSAAIDLIRHCVDCKNPYVLTLAWKFVDLSVMIGENDEIYASTLTDKAVSTIVATETKTYNEYQVKALEFLTKLIGIRPVTCTEMNADAVIDAITTILEKFPSHSIALTAVFEFAKVALDNIYLRPKIISEFLSVVFRVLEDKDSNRTQYAFCEKFMCDIRAIARHDPLIEEELPAEIQDAYRIADDYESYICSSSRSRASEYFNDMIDDIDLSMVRTGQIVSSQDF